MPMPVLSHPAPAQAAVPPHGGPLPDEEDLDAALAQAMQTAMSSSGLAATAAVVSKKQAPAKKQPERTTRDTGEVAFQATIQFNKDQIQGAPHAPPGAAPQAPPQAPPQAAQQPPPGPAPAAGQAAPPKSAPPQAAPGPQPPDQRSQDGDFVSSLLDEIDWDELSLSEEWGDGTNEG